MQELSIWGGVIAMEAEEQAELDKSLIHFIKKEIYHDGIRKSGLVQKSILLLGDQCGEV